MASDRLLHVMAEPVEKHGEFRVTSQFAIVVQPLSMEVNIE